MKPLIPLKATMKRSLAHVAARFGPHRREPATPQLLILMYHRVLPADDPRAALEEPGMLVTPQTFRSNLQWLQQYFKVVSLGQWLEDKINGRELPLKACAVTFDDGWADNYEFAFPILQELQIPATIFLVADMINTDGMFWPERLARIAREISNHHPDFWSNSSTSWLHTNNTSFGFGNIPPDSEQISQLVSNAKHFTDLQVHQRLDMIETELGLQIKPVTAALLNWQQLVRMSETKLVEAGSHTCHHIRLNNATPIETQKKEIMDSKTIIEKHTNQPVRTFCFPNGDYSQQTLELVKQTYLGAVTTQTGWNSIATDNHMLHRIGVHEDIARDKVSFLARISSWL